MLRIGLQREPYWFALEGLGVRLKVRPASAAVLAVAQQHAKRKVADLIEKASGLKEVGAEPAPDLMDPAVREAMAHLIFCKALAKAAIVGWEGVMQSDCDEPAPITPQAINDLMDLPGVPDLFAAEYLAPRRMLASEGNSSGSAPNGTSAAEPVTAASATNPTPLAAVASEAATASAVPA